MLYSKENRDALLESRVKFHKKNRTLRIWRMYQNGYSMSAIAEEENICRMTVYRILRKANSIIESAIMQEQEGDIRLAITIKQNGEVIDSCNITMLSAFKNMVRERREKELKEQEQWEKRH